MAKDEAGESVRRDEREAVARRGDDARESTLDATLATPAGRGAVATIMIAGSDSRRCVARRLRLASSGTFLERAANTPVFGRWRLDGGLEEEVVAAWRVTADASAEWCELHCHGGVAVAESILDGLRRDGARSMTPAEWAARRGLDRAEIDLRERLARCRTARAALVLLDQRDGAWPRAAVELERLADEGRDAELRARCARLRSLTSLGARLDRPWQVALAGRPNAGKSTLLNALAGYERALVHSAPGTTRDVVAVETAVDGWPVELLDTAGLRESAETLEAAGIRRAEAMHEEADLLLVVADRSAPWTDVERRLVLTHPSPLVVHSQIDRVAGRENAGDRPSGVEVSARTGAGLAELLAAISRRLVPAPPAPGEVVPLEPRQSDWLAAFAAESLRRSRASAGGRR